jgi:hypothetical protein
LISKPVTHRIQRDARRIGSLSLCSLLFAISTAVAECPRDPELAFRSVRFADIDPGHVLPIVPVNLWSRSILDGRRPFSSGRGPRMVSEMALHQGWIVHQSLQNVECVSKAGIEVFSNRERVDLPELRDIFKALHAIPVSLHGDSMVTRITISEFPEVVFVSWDSSPTVVLRRDPDNGALRLVNLLSASSGFRRAQRHTLLGHPVYVLEPQPAYSCEWSQRTRPERQRMLVIDEYLALNPFISSSIGYDRFKYLDTELAFGRYTSHLEGSHSFSPPFGNACRCPHYTTSYSLLHPESKEPVAFTSTLHVRWRDGGLIVSRLHLDVLDETDPADFTTLSCCSDSQERELGSAYIAESWVFSLGYWCGLAEALRQSHTIPVEVSFRLKEVILGSQSACELITPPQAGELGSISSLGFLRAFTSAPLEGTR